jgi:hypothetical protein
MIELKGSAVDAMAAALAHISGSTKILTRSILTTQAGFVAWHLTVTDPMRGPGFVWSLIEKYMPNIRQQVRSMKVQKDRMGAVFDVYVLCLSFKETHTLTHIQTNAHQAERADGPDHGELARLSDNQAAAVQGASRARRRVCKQVIWLGPLVLWHR